MLATSSTCAHHQGLGRAHTRFCCTRETLQRRRRFRSGMSRDSAPFAEPRLFSGELPSLCVVQADLVSTQPSTQVAPTTSQIHVRAHAPWPSPLRITHALNASARPPPPASTLRRWNLELTWRRNYGALHLGLVACRDQRRTRTSCRNEPIQSAHDKLCNFRMSLVSRDRRTAGAFERVR